MRWMYRIQQHLSITPHECGALLGLAVLLGIGLMAQHVQSQPQPLPEDYYAEQDRRFTEAAAKPLAPVPEADGARLPVPSEVVPEDTTKQETKPRQAPPEGPAASTVHTPRMNLNVATASQLERLPRIGPALSGRIVAYREAHGGFRQVADLVAVRGIGEKTLARVEPYLFVPATEEP